VRLDGCQSPCPHCGGSERSTGPARVISGSTCRAKSDRRAGKPGSRAVTGSRTAIGSSAVTSDDELISGPSGRSGAGNPAAARWNRASAAPAADACPGPRYGDQLTASR
jgi:hypothetical protein